jgi:hypothetical protein
MCFAHKEAMKIFLLYSLLPTPHFQHRGEILDDRSLPDDVPD